MADWSVPGRTITGPKKYIEALIWIAQNDDTEWLVDGVPIPSVTGSLTMSLFNKRETSFVDDLRAVVAFLRKKETPDVTKADQVTRMHEIIAGKS